jgi:hypothetical protein
VETGPKLLFMAGLGKKKQRKSREKAEKKQRKSREKVR